MADRVAKCFRKVVKKHGNGAAVSLHEIRGLLAEEIDEFNDEVRANNNKKAKEELIDIAIIALFGIDSINSWKRK